MISAKQQSKNVLGAISISALNKMINSVPGFESIKSSSGDFLNKLYL